jgi:hypothetical protein
MADAKPKEDARGDIAASSGAPTLDATSITRLFWLLFVVCCLAMAIPIWVGPFPDWTDFGGHLQVVDAWVKFDENPLFQKYLERQTGFFEPNRLMVRFVDLLYPAVETLPGLRLYSILGVWGISGGIVYALRAFGRSRWLTFVAMPFIWGGAINMGAVNYIWAIGLFFVGIGIARRAAIEGGHRWTGIIAVFGLFTYLQHAFGFMMTVASMLGIMILTVRTYKNLIPAAGLIPSVLVFLPWMTGRLTKSSDYNTDFVQDVPISMKLEWLYFGMFDVSYDGAALIATITAVILWVAFLALSFKPKKPDEATPAKDLAYFRNLGCNHALTLLFFAFLIGYVVLPIFLVDVVFIRLMNPLFILMMMLPTVRAESLPGPRKKAFYGLTAVAVIMVFVLSATVTSSVVEFQRVEIEPLTKVIDKIPEKQRVFCVGVQDIDSYGEAYPIPSPLSFNCNGLIQYRTGGFAGGGFAFDGYNPVLLKRDAFPESLIRFVKKDPSGAYWLNERWTRDPHLKVWDYIVERGGSGARRRIRRLHSVKAPDDSLPWMNFTPTWALYQIKSTRARAGNR